MSAYEVPASAFNANEWARNKVLSANQFRTDTVNRYKLTYEKFWDINISETGRSQSEMQAILDVLGTTAASILTDSATYNAALESNWPGELQPIRFKGVGSQGRLLILSDQHPIL